MIFKKIFLGLDTIHISITRPRNIISFTGESGEPTDKVFHGILNILLGKNYIIYGGSKKFVNNGSEYIQSNSKEVLVQLRSVHLMKFGSQKVQEIFDFLLSIGIKPKPKRSRAKNHINETSVMFYQITRLDFTVDYETSFDLIKILNEKIGYSRFFEGIQKGYFYRVIHENKRNHQGNREHLLKEIKIFNSGFELAIYNKKKEIAEEATPEKLALYPDVYREILSAPKRQLFRVELRFFRFRSIAFNALSVYEIFALPRQELVKFGKSTKLIKTKRNHCEESSLFSRLFSEVLK